MSEQEQKTKLFWEKYSVAGSIIMAAILISGTIFLTRSQVGNDTTKGSAKINGAAGKGQSVDVKISPDDHVLGDKNAPITIIEYADFRCPFCERFFTQSEKQIVSDYINTGKAKFIFRNYAFLGQQSIWASEAAECAGEQNKYWEYYNWLFNNQASESDLNYYSKANLVKYAGRVGGINAAQFTSCLNSDKYSNRVVGDLASGKSLGITGTPTLLVLKDKNPAFDVSYVSAQMQARQNIIKLPNSNIVIVGAQPLEVFKSAIDQILK